MLVPRLSFLCVRSFSLIGAHFSMADFQSVQNFSGMQVCLGIGWSNIHKFGMWTPLSIGHLFSRIGFIYTCVGNHVFFSSCQYTHSGFWATLLHCAVILHTDHN